MQGQAAPTSYNGSFVPIALNAAIDTQINKDSSQSMFLTCALYTKIGPGATLSAFLFFCGNNTPKVKVCESPVSARGQVCDHGQVPPNYRFDPYFPITWLSIISVLPTS